MLFVCVLRLIILHVARFGHAQASAAKRLRSSRLMGDLARVDAILHPVGLESTRELAESCHIGSGKLVLKVNRFVAFLDDSAVAALVKDTTGRCLAGEHCRVER